MLTYVQKQFSSSAHLLTIPPPILGLCKTLTNSNLSPLYVCPSVRSEQCDSHWLYIFGKFHFSVSMKLRRHTTIVAKIGQR